VKQAVNAAGLSASLVAKMSQNIPCLVRVFEEVRIVNNSLWEPSRQEID
jgi:hypothetical protein